MTDLSEEQTAKLYGLTAPEPDWFDMEGRATFLPLKTRKDPPAMFDRVGFNALLPNNQEWAMPGMFAGLGNFVQDAGRAATGTPVAPERAIEDSMNLLGNNVVLAGKGAVAPLPGVMNMLVGENAKLPPRVMDRLAEAKKLKAKGISRGAIAQATGWDDRVGQWEYDVPEFTKDFPKIIASNSRHEHPVLNQVYPDREFGQVVNPNWTNNSLSGEWVWNPSAKDYVLRSKQFNFKTEYPSASTWAHEGQHAADIESGVRNFLSSRKNDASGVRYNPKTGTHNFYNIPTYLRNRTEIRARVNELRLNWSEDLRRHIPARDMHEWEAERLAKIQAKNPELKPGSKKWWKWTYPTAEEYADFLRQYLPEEYVRRAVKNAEAQGKIDPRSPETLEAIRDTARSVLKKRGIAHTEAFDVKTGKKVFYNLRKWGTQEDVDPATLDEDLKQAWKILNDPEPSQ